MTIDLKTAVTLLIITHIVQIVIFSQQYVTNKYLKEIKWWLFWSIAEVAAFLFIFMRGVPELHTLVIVGQNTAMVLGTLFLYIGTLRFFGKRENVKLITISMIIFVLIFIYFTGIDENIQVRSTFINLYMSAFSALAAVVLLKNKLSAHRSTLYILTFSFLLNGIVFGFRAVLIAAGLYDVSNFFSPDPLNVITYISGIIVSILWTFGYVVLINQRVNKMLSEVKEHFELIFNTSPEAAVITRLTDGLIIDVNNNFTEILGYSREEAIGASSIKANIWKDPHDREKIVKEILHSGHCDNFQTEFVRKDGKVILGLMSAAKIMLNDVPHIISITRDVTELKKTEEEIREKLVQYSNLANSSTALIWRSGTDKLCNYFNEPWLKFTGRTLEQEMGNGWAEGVHADDFERCLNTYVAAFDNQEKFEMEYRLRNAKGEYRWLIDMGTPNYNSKNEFTGYIGHCFDITDRKNDEAELNRKVKELKELNDLMLDRELKMIELKKEINQLMKESGKPEKY